MADSMTKQLTLTWADQFEAEDLEARHLFLNDQVDENLIVTLVYSIQRYNRLDKGLDPKDRKPIYLYLNTPGGQVIDGYSLVDTITTSITPVYVVNVGLCASMGFIIFISGHKRFALPHSQFLMHDGSSVCWDSTAKAKDRMDFELNQVEKATKEFIVGHTKISDKLYDKKYRVEWYMYPHEAKEMGVVDHIVGEDCTMDDIL